MRPMGSGLLPPLALSSSSRSTAAPSSLAPPHHLGAFVVTLFGILTVFHVLTHSGAGSRTVVPLDDVKILIEDDPQGILSPAAVCEEEPLAEGLPGEPEILPGELATSKQCGGSRFLISMSPPPSSLPPSHLSLSPPYLRYVSVPTYLPSYPPTYLPNHLPTYLPTYLRNHLPTYLPT